jgi:hypothetical protein
MAGGIGVTPLITMAHRLHALGRDFDLHYSAASRESCGFAGEIEATPWAGRAHLHFSREGGRADLRATIPDYAEGMKLYTCGSDRYMDAVFAAAQAKGWPEEALSKEYFTGPRAARLRQPPLHAGADALGPQAGGARRQVAPPMCWQRRASPSPPSARTGSAGSAPRRIRARPRSSTATMCSRPPSGKQGDPVLLAPDTGVNLAIGGGCDGRLLGDREVLRSEENGGRKLMGIQGRSGAGEAGAHAQTRHCSG